MKPNLLLFVVLAAICTSNAQEGPPQPNLGQKMAVVPQNPSNPVNSASPALDLSKPSGQGSLTPPGLNVPGDNNDPTNDPGPNMPQGLQTQASNPSQIPNPAGQSLGSQNANPLSALNNQGRPGRTPGTGNRPTQMNGMSQLPNMGIANSNEYSGYPSDLMSTYAQNFANQMSQYSGNMPGMPSSHKHSHGQNSPWDQSPYSMSNNWPSYGEQNFGSQQTNDYDYGDDDSYSNPLSQFQGQNSPFLGQYASGHKSGHHHNNDYSGMFGSNFDPTQSNSYGSYPFGQSDEYDQSNDYNQYGMNAFGSNQGYGQGSNYGYSHGSGQNSFGNYFENQFPKSPNTGGFFPNSAQNLMPDFENGQNPLSQGQSPYGQSPMNPGHQNPGFGQTATNPYAPNQNPYAANTQMNPQSISSNPLMNQMASMPNSGGFGQNFANMPQSVQNPGLNGNPGFGGKIPLNFASGTPQTQQQLLANQPQAMGFQAQNLMTAQGMNQMMPQNQAQNPMMPQAQNSMMPQGMNQMMPQNQAQNPMMPQAQNSMMPQGMNQMMLQNQPQNPMMPLAQNSMMPQGQNPMTPQNQVQNPMTPQNPMMLQNQLQNSMMPQAQVQNPLMNPSAQNPAMMTQQTPGMPSNLGQPLGMQPPADQTGQFGGGAGSALGGSPQKCINQANDVQCSQYAMNNMCSQHKVDCAAACGGC